MFSNTKRNSVLKANGNSAPPVDLPQVPNEPLPVESLTPRDVVVKSTASTEAVVAYSLPPTSTTLGGSVDVRVLVRPSRFYKETLAEDRRLSQAIMRLRMDHSMAMTKNAGKPGVNQHELFLELNKQLTPLNQQLSEIWSNYTSKCREIFNRGPPPSDELEPIPRDGWYSVVGPDLIFKPTANFIEADLVTIPQSPEANTITLKNLASNVFFEVAMVAKRTATPSSESSNDRIWSPISPIVGFSTKTAAWQLALEKAGLRHFIEPFTVKGLDSFQSWMEISQDLKEELGIDAASEQVLSDILSTQGIITAAEQARIDRERAEMTGVVNTLLADLRGQEGAIGTGDAVTEKIPSNKRRGAKFGVIVSVNGDSCSVRWEDPRTKDPGNSTVENNVKLSTVVRSSFSIFMSHAQADAQNQVAHLSVLLRDREAKIWFDMDSERLEARDMVRGISNSKVFLLYLTKSYFDRWFCRLEASVARAMNKPLIIVYEPDERHGGKADYVGLVTQCTQKFPEFRDFLLTTEAIPMARRSFQRRAVVDEICKRAGLQNKLGSFTEKEGGGSTGLLSSIAGSSSGSAAGTLMEISDLRQMLLDLKMEITDLKAENRELRQMVEQITGGGSEQ